jgi:hypothetical protein
MHRTAGITGNNTPWTHRLTQPERTVAVVTKRVRACADQPEMLYKNMHRFGARLSKAGGLVLGRQIVHRRLAGCLASMATLRLVGKGNIGRRLHARGAHK